MQYSPSHILGLTFRYGARHSGKLIAGSVIFAAIVGVILVGMTIAAFRVISMASQLFAAPQVADTLPAGVAFPGMGLFMLFGPVLMGVVGFLSFGYFLALGLEGQRSVGGLFGRAFQLFFPLVAISFWTFLRSFLWVPFILQLFMSVLGATGMQDAIGPLMGAVGLLNLGLTLWFMPRLMFAPVLYVHEHLGIRESVEASYRRTQGKWGDIVLSLLLWMVVVILVAIGIVLLVAMLLAVVMASELPLMAIVLILPLVLFLMVSGYATLFTVTLGLVVTATENPQGAPVGTPAVVGEA